MIETLAQITLKKRGTATLLSTTFTQLNSTQGEFNVLLYVGGTNSVVMVCGAATAADALTMFNANKFIYLISQGGAGIKQYPFRLDPCKTWLFSTDTSATQGDASNEFIQILRQH